MKKLFTYFVLSTGLLSAQLKDNYTIKSQIKTEGVPAEYAAFGEMEVTTYIKGEKTRSETTNMMFSNISVFDGTTVTFLSEAMGNKNGYTATKEELENLDKNKPTEKPKIEYVNEKKTIAGIECMKAIVTNIDKEKKERTSIIWYTETLKGSNPLVRKANRRGMGPDLSELKGVPLSVEFTMNMQGMEVKTVMMATEISTNAIDDSLFNPSKEGYSMSTIKEYQEKMKSMGGR